MAQKTKKTSPQKRLLPNEEHEIVTLWKQHGKEDVYFQREVQVNFWTILGGIAVAALLTKMTNLIEGIQMGRWHLLLYFLASIILIVNSWVQQAWGSFVLRVPVTMLHSLLMLLNLVFLAILRLQVTNPSGYPAATAGIIFFALVNQIYFEKTGAWKDFSPKNINRIRFINGAY